MNNMYNNENMNNNNYNNFNSNQNANNFQQRNLAYNEQSINNNSFSQQQNFNNNINNSEQAFPSNNSFNNGNSSNNNFNSENKFNVSMSSSKQEGMPNQPNLQNPVVPKKKMDPAKKRSICTIILSFCAAMLACLLVTSFGSCNKGVVIGGNGVAITQADDSDTLAEAVAQKCLPSVLSVNVYSKKSQKATEEKSSLGSGVIISEDGYVITNQHVINGAYRITTLYDGEEKDADLIGQDESSDIAVIKIKNVSGLPAVEIGNSDELKIGEWVMAAGNPFGLEQSVSTGIVSAKSRSTTVSGENGEADKVYTNLIQTDASINPGNSGGLLANKKGQMVGINTLIVSGSGTSSGVGFAIPVNYAIDLAKQIIDGKTPSHAKLGVVMSDVTESIAKQNNLKVNSGVLVTEVSGAAQQAGIEVGDVIVKIDNTDIKTSSQVMTIVRSHFPGETITVIVNRDGTEHSIRVTLS